MTSLLEDKSIWVEAASDAAGGRRSTRIHAEFWVKILGVESSPRRRPGDLSVTGIYVSTDVPVGSPGDLVELEISSVDRMKTLQTPARVTRVIRQDDVERGLAVIGVAFEFVHPRKLKSRVVELLNHVASHELMTFGNIRLDQPLPAVVSSPNAGTFRGTVQTLGSELILLKVGQRVEHRSDIELEISYGKEGVARLRGRVVRCTPQYVVGEETQYGLLVQFETRLGTPSEPSPADLVQDIICSLVVPVDLRMRSHESDLMGQLSHVRLTSVLSLIEIDRLTGTLIVANSEDCVTIRVSEGRVVGCESTASEASSEALLAEVHQWPDGEFKFRAAKATGSRAPEADASPEAWH